MILTEREARKMTECVCGAPKDMGCVVCWNCFKYIKKNPLKYFGGTFEEWQEKRNEKGE